jgi:hypothetical protein
MSVVVGSTLDVVVIGSRLVVVGWKLGIGASSWGAEQAAISTNKNTAVRHIGIEVMRSAVLDH